MILCGSTVFSGSTVLSTTVMKTLFKSRHIVYSEWPSPSLCGNLKTKHYTTTQGQPPTHRCETLSFAPKKRQKSQSGAAGSALIYCLNLGTELWPRTYLGGLMWRMKSSGNAEWILSIRSNTWCAVEKCSAVTDSMTGAVWNVSHICPSEKYLFYDFLMLGNPVCVLLELSRYIQNITVYDSMGKLTRIQVKNHQIYILKKDQ